MTTLYDKLIKLRKFHKCAFHMPGSKGGRAIPRKYRNNVWKLDYTETSKTDNLYSPEGIIKDAQQRAADIYKSNRCFYLVNGTSCGILATIGYLSTIGKKIIVDRNCHISVLNAIRLFNMTPVFATPEYIPEFGITGKISAEYIKNLIQANPDVTSVFLTSPNYYGMVHDIKSISSVCKETGKLLCVDAAHGAHFTFSEKLPSCPVTEGADIAVMSVHKTLPAPTQTAIMHISDSIDADLIKQQINTFQTTSPSYIFMAYTDMAISYMNKHGEKIFDNLHKQIVWFKNNCRLKVIETDDFSRLVINTCSTGKSGFELSDFLEKHGIVVEAADLYNIVCICGKGNTHRDFSLIAKYCNLFSKTSSSAQHPVSEVVLSKGSPSFCIDLPIKETELENCEDKICAQTITTYPPGVPVIFEGERFEISQIKYISRLLQLGGTAIGIKNGKVKYFEEDR